MNMDNLNIILTIIVSIITLTALLIPLYEYIIQNKKKRAIIHFSINIIIIVGISSYYYYIYLPNEKNKPNKEVVSLLSFAKQDTIASLNSLHNDLYYRTLLKEQKGVSSADILPNLPNVLMDNSDRILLSEYMQKRIINTKHALTNALKNYNEFDEKEKNNVVLFVLQQLYLEFLVHYFNINTEIKFQKKNIDLATVNEEMTDSVDFKAMMWMFGLPLYFNNILPLNIDKKPLSLVEKEKYSFQLGYSIYLLQKKSLNTNDIEKIQAYLNKLYFPIDIKMLYIKNQEKKNIDEVNAFQLKLFEDLFVLMYDKNDTIPFTLGYHLRTHSNTQKQYFSDLELKRDTDIHNGKVFENSLIISNMMYSTTIPRNLIEEWKRLNIEVYSKHKNNVSKILDIEKKIFKHFTIDRKEKLIQ